MLVVTASNQLTVDYKNGKSPSLGSWTASIIAFQDLRFYHALSPLSKLPMMDVGRRVPEKTLPSIGLIVSWLLAVTNGITFQNERVREKEGVSVIDYVLLELLAASMHSFTDSTWTGLLQHPQDVPQHLNFWMDLAVQSVWACSCKCTVRLIKKFRHWETSCGSRSGPVQIK